MLYKEFSEKNKSILVDYLSDFHPEKANEISSKFNDIDFTVNYTTFKKNMTKLCSMPPCGKNTLRYWISRGWNNEEAEQKRVKKVLGPRHSPMSIEFWLAKGYTVDQADYQIKSQRKVNKEYWIKLGYSLSDAVDKVKEFQRENLCKLNHKRKTDKKFDDSFRQKKSMNIFYWINKGFTEEEAKLKVSERQRTFSLDICIEKYGYEIGKARWEERQRKWLESLSKSDYNGSDNKDSRTINFFKKKYGKNWIEPYISGIAFKEKNEIYHFLSFSDYKYLIDFLIKRNDKFSSIHRTINSQIIAEHYQTTKEEMYSYLKNNFGIKPKKSFDYIRRIHQVNWLDKIIEIEQYKDKDFIYFLVSFENYEVMLDNLISEYSITFIVQQIKKKIISYFYETTFEKMFEYLISKDIHINSKFGHMRHFNGHLCRSDGEFIIANFLKNNNIVYEYEKNYPNSKKRCDFYLIEKNIFLEFTGMAKFKKNFDNYQEKIQFCVSNNLDHIFSNNLDDIKNKIKKIYEIQNNS